MGYPFEMFSNKSRISWLSSPVLLSVWSNGPRGLIWTLVRGLYLIGFFQGNLKKGFLGGLKPFTKNRMDINSYLMYLIVSF